MTTGEKKNKQMEQTFEAVFLSDRGRVVLRHLMTKFHYYGDVADEIERGERRVVLFILQMCQMSQMPPDEVLEQNRLSQREYDWAGAPVAPITEPTL